MLNNALDYGISEAEFWEMTFAELDRLVESKQRVEKHMAQERATFDYILASLIGRAYAASMDNKVTFPEIHEAYPSLFNREERENQKQERSNQLSALRFKQFAQSYNKKFKEVASDK
jgi:chromatin segregation and condensation protein Rec8/ScpA/Scc1 (kleisin family)